MSNAQMNDKPVAVVTGGARGIGEAAVRKFAALGYRVAALDVNKDRGLALEREFGPDRMRFFECDVSDAGAVEALADRCHQDLGPADFLVAAAGLIPNTESVMEMDLVAHERMWKVNYNGTLHACRSFGRQMIAKGGGAMVTLGSINSLMALPLPAYNPGKAAIMRLTELLAAELGRHRIRVNSVAPTYVMTPELQARIDSGQRDLAKMMSVHTLGRLPTPGDVAEVIAFLCSPAASCITGVLLPVDSGWSVGVSYMSYAGGVPWRDA